MPRILNLGSLKFIDVGFLYLGPFQRVYVAYYFQLVVGPQLQHDHALWQYMVKCFSYM